jgi:glutaredoxin
MSWYRLVQLYSPASRELKALLSVFHLKPAPTIVDVDMRDDAAVLAPILARTSGVDELPLLIIGGKPVGGLEEAKLLHRNGELEKLMRAAGAEINGARGKKGRKNRR